MHYIHIASIVLAVLVPLPSGLVPLKDGYVTTEYPTILCISRNVDYIYGLFIAPVSVSLAVSTSLQLVLFWILLKVQQCTMHSTH